MPVSYDERRKQMNVWAFTRRPMDHPKIRADHAGDLCLNVGAHGREVLAGRRYVSGPAYRPLPPASPPRRYTSCNGNRPSVTMPRSSAWNAWDTANWKPAAPSLIDCLAYTLASPFARTSR